MTQFRETGLGARGWHTHACMHAKSLELRPTLCDPMDCSLPGSSVYGILQARILEWGAIHFTRRSSQPRDRTQVLHYRQILYHLRHWESPGAYVCIFIFVCAC